MLSVAYVKSQKSDGYNSNKDKTVKVLKMCKNQKNSGKWLTNVKLG